MKRDNCEQESRQSSHGTAGLSLAISLVVPSRFTGYSIWYEECLEKPLPRQELVHYIVHLLRVIYSSFAV